MILAAVTEYETASLAIAEAGLYIAVATAFASTVSAVAVAIWGFGIATNRSNKHRAEADQHRAETEERRADAERDRHEESMMALKELIRRTAPQAGPAEWRNAGAPAKSAGPGSFHPLQRIGAHGEFGPACSPNAVGPVGPPCPVGRGHGGIAGRLRSRGRTADRQ